MPPRSSAAPSPTATADTEPAPPPEPTDTSVPRAYGVVVDKDGRPVPGVIVHRVYTTELGDELRPATRTDTYGRWDMPCGSDTIVFAFFRFYGDGTAGLHALGYVHLADAPCGEPIRTTMRPGGAVLGRVTGDDGAPVRESRPVSLMCPEDAATACQVVQSDGEGRYHFFGLHAGEYQVVEGGRSHHVTVGESALSPTPSPSPRSEPSDG